MRLRSFVAVALIAAPLGAQAGPPHVPTAADSMPSVALPPALDRVLRDYERAWTARDAAGLAALFTEDGFVLSGNQPPARGRDAIRQRYAGAGGPLFLRAVAWAMDDTVAYIIGMYGPSVERHSNGKFTLTLRRAHDGRWLIASDMDNPNRPPRRMPLPAIGASLGEGAQLVYESAGSRQAPWIYDSVRVVQRDGFARCVVVTRRGLSPRESCARGDTLFERAASGAYRPARPIGPGMVLETRTTAGSTMRFMTAEPTLRIGPGGVDIMYLPTMILTMDSTGTITQRLREEYAPALLTALAGAFEVPDGAGWRVTRSFTLAELVAAPRQ